MRALGPGLLACLCLAPGLAAAQEGELSSRRDHMLAINRDLAVACKPGDLERVPGRSLGEVFGDAWPAPLEADSDTPHTGPRMASIANSAASNLGPEVAEERDTTEHDDRAHAEGTEDSGR